MLNFDRSAVKYGTQNIQNGPPCSAFLTALECIKLVFGRGSTPDPLGELTALTRPPTSLRGPTSKGEEKRGRGKERVRERKRRGDRPPLSQIPGFAPEQNAVELSTSILPIQYQHSIGVCTFCFEQYYSQMSAKITAVLFLHPLALITN